MQSIDTLTDFLAVAGANHEAETEYRIYDLSRVVQPLSAADFHAIEKAERPFPRPRQQHAWLGIVLQQKQQLESSELHDPYIWFVKLPLDERGLFEHAARQHFLSIIVEALGENPTVPPSAEQEKRQQQNPYIFTPDEARRAAFHAQVSHDLQRPASVYYTAALAFLQGERSENDWHDIGVQGIHDVVTRNLHEPEIQQHISKQLLQWPAPLQQAAMEALEHAILPSKLSAQLVNQLHTVGQAQQIILLRCLAKASNEDRVASAVQAILQTAEAALTQQPEHANNADENIQDLLLTIGARNWATLAVDTNLARYLSAVALLNEHMFIQVFRDLVMLPELRPLMLQLFGSNELSPALQRGIAALITHTRSAQ